MFKMPQPGETINEIDGIFVGEFYPAYDTVYEVVEIGKSKWGDKYSPIIVKHKEVGTSRIQQCDLIYFKQHFLNSD